MSMFNKDITWFIANIAFSTCDFMQSSILSHIYRITLYFVCSWHYLSFLIYFCIYICKDCTETLLHLNEPNSLDLKNNIFLYHRAFIFTDTDFYSLHMFSCYMPSVTWREVIYCIVIYNKESRRIMSFRVFSLFLWITVATIIVTENIYIYIYIYILPIEASVFFLTTVEGPSHSICQLGFQVFILLARRQIKGIMDRTEPGFC